MAIEKRILGVPFKVASTLNEGAWKLAEALDTYVPDDIVSFLERLEPDARFSYVHLIAMSDGDFYGSNLNGDVFTAEELTGLQSQAEADKNTGELKGKAVPRFKTFEQAKFFKHHRNGPTDTAYGDVPCAAWNDRMRRVELVVRVAKQPIPELKLEAAPDVITKLDRRGYLTVSMGTRIAYERCRYCGHQNEFIHQRCSHLRDHMNEIMPDGKLVSAENYGCRFFDISDVTVPADPIAFSLQKVAGAGQGANPAYDAGYPAMTLKRSEIEKQIPATSTVADNPVAAAKVEVVPEFTDEELKKAAADGFEAALGTAANLGIVFSPREFVTVMAHTGGDEFGLLPLDKFSHTAYNALREKLAARSGFVAPCLATGWEPAKLADAGHPEIAAAYARYREALSSLPRSTFTKAAHAIPAARELLSAGSLTSAFHQLAFAGISH